MPPWSNGYHPNEFNWIYSQFDQPVEFDRARNTAQNGSKFTEITLYPSLVELGMTTKFDRALITGQIG